MKADPSGLTMLGKAAVILEALDETDQPRRLSDISRTTHLSVGTVHRHLQEMAELGWATRDESRGWRRADRAPGGAR